MEPMQKVCKYCKKAYPESAFGVAATTPTKVYRRLKCRFCYRDAKQKLIQRHHQWINTYKKQRGCGKCGVTDPRVLDFHHKNDKNKLFTVGGFRRAVGFERIKNEVQKCDVVCANCHRILHNEIRGGTDIQIGA